MRSCIGNFLDKGKHFLKLPGRLLDELSIHYRLTATNKMNKPNEVEEEHCQQSQLVTKTLAQEKHGHRAYLPVVLHRMLFEQLVQKPARWILAESLDFT